MKTFNEKEFAAAKVALSIAFDREVTDEDVQHYINCEYLTINEGRNGHTYAWYLDSDNCVACVDIDTLEELTIEDIEKYLC